MKELTIEQKAQRYDKALAKARTIVNSINVGLIGKDSFEAVFPELKESEGERMVKFIKNQLFNIKKTITENYELDAKLTKAIDWLEKQGEQKSNQEKVLTYKHGFNDCKEHIEEVLLSEVLPCFMHGGEADEVVAKLDEVLSQKK